MTIPKVLIFGAGKAGEAAFESISQTHNVLAFIDNNVSKQANLICGKKVIAPTQIAQFEFDKILIASEFSEQIEKQLTEMRTIDCAKIETLSANQIKFTQLEENSAARQHAIELLNIMSKKLEDKGIKYYTDAGTLLGIIRDKELIPWDDDIDFAVASSECKKLEEILAEVCRELFVLFGVEWRFSIQKSTHHFGVISIGDIASYKLHATKALSAYPQIDFFVKYQNAETMEYVLASRGIRMPSHHFEGTYLIDFKDFKVRIPSDVEGYLAKHYGDDWKVPRKEWNLSMIQSATPFMD